MKKARTHRASSDKLSFVVSDPHYFLFFVGRPLIHRLDEPVGQLWHSPPVHNYGQLPQIAAATNGDR
jgi:hypothetical protein